MNADVCLLVFDGMTMQDIVGPAEVLGATPGVDIRFVAASPGPVRNDRRQLVVECDQHLADLVDDRPDAFVMGGGNMYPLLRDPEFLARLGHVVHRSRWKVSVCTGSELLGALGLLRGRRATTLWPFLDRLRDVGAEPVSRRWVVDGDVVTSAGITAGIDLALWLARELAGEDAAEIAQLAVEYDPAPPFDRGHPRTARPEIVERVDRWMHGALARMQDPSA